MADTTIHSRASVLVLRRDYVLQSGTSVHFPGDPRGFLANCQAKRSPSQREKRQKAAQNITAAPFWITCGRNGITGKNNGGNKLCRK